MTAGGEVTLQEAARTIYAGLTDEALKEASRLDAVDGEIALLRVWLLESIAEEPRDAELMKALFAQIVRAVAVKYRLSPKRAEQVESALAAVIDGIGGQIRPEEMEV